MRSRSLATSSARPFNPARSVAAAACRARCSARERAASRACLAVPSAAASPASAAPCADACSAVAAARAAAQPTGSATSGPPGRLGVVVGVGTLRQRDAGRLADAVRQGVDGAPMLLAGVVQGQPALAQPALHLLEPAGVEQLLQQPVPVLRRRAQERLEAALRQHRDLGELGEVHAHQPGHQVPGLVESGGQRSPGAGDALADVHRGLLRGGAGAAPLRTRPGGAADDPEPSAGQGRLELDPRGGAGSAWSERSRLASLRSPGTAP